MTAGRQNCGRKRAAIACLRKNARIKQQQVPIGFRHSSFGFANLGEKSFKPSLNLVLVRP